MRRRDFPKMVGCPAESRALRPGMICPRIFPAGMGLLCAVLAVGYGPCAAAAGAGPSRVISLSGSDWSLHDDPDGQGADRRLDVADPSAPGATLRSQRCLPSLRSTSWIPASVPGNIQADLEAAHQLKPLWYGAGDPRMHEAARKDWWYRKDFQVPADFAGQRVRLVFDGVDHECDLWLNGRRIGRNAGMFRRFEFDVADGLKFGQKNQLAVRIARIPEPLAPVILGADAPGGALVGPAVHKTRAFLKELKSPTNAAWDWAVAVYTLGIWKDVRLEASGPARIQWVRVRTDLLDDYRKATVKAGLEVDSLADLAAKVSFRAVGQRSAAARTIDAALKKGPNQIDVEIPLERPALWWPNGQGDQPLYELQSEIRTAGSGELVDRRTTRFGVREIRWEQVPGAPADFINPLKLVVNGRPVRQLGSNLIPPDCLFGRIDRRGLRLLELARAAGINCLRVWGGGVIFSEAMYDRADELGIMFLQEFPLANAWPETDAVFLANLETTITDIVKQTRNHPCIVEWSGGNEMPWRNGTKHPALQVLEKIVREQDRRMFRSTEPAQGSGAHGSYTYVYHNEPAGYLSWLGAGSSNLYRRYNTAQQMRISEFGTNSPANLEVWHREIPPSSQWPLENLSDPILIRKNVFHGAMLAQNWLHKEIVEGLFGPADGLGQIVQAGQFLGAEGLRYAMDALRRKGTALGGGFMSWNYNEPWPNGAGSYLVDYDGRPLMNYDFVKQALVPISLTLQYDSLLYDPSAGVKAELYLASDAPQAAQALRWRWLARDRRGQVFAQGEGAAAIGPQEVKRLAALDLKPPKQTAYGPLFVEMQLSDGSGRVLAERIHVFGIRGVRGSLGGLLKNRQPDQDDNAPGVGDQIPRPDGPRNLAFVGNGARPASASSARPEPIHQPKGLNDGLYGNDHSWIGAEPRSSFQIDLGKAATVGRFKLGRDRTGQFGDRAVQYLKIETSSDGKQWRTVYEKQGVASMPGYEPAKTMEIQAPPAEARFVRVTVGPAEACLDEFEAYPPEADHKGESPRVTFSSGLAQLCRPVRRTSVTVTARPVRIDAGQEVLELAVNNDGPMTALFCEPQALLEYRTDLFVDNNHCFIPPGQSRTITIRSSSAPPGGLSLAQTGWRISTWNADDRVIAPCGGLLLALGRRDAMCREFAGYNDPKGLPEAANTALSGRRPEASGVPCLLKGNAAARFKFTVEAGQVPGGARLRLHSADQSAAVATDLAITMNGRLSAVTLPKGLGIQDRDPAHLAFPATAQVDLPPGALQAGQNVLEVRVSNGGWFTWDALDLTAK